MCGITVPAGAPCQGRVGVALKFSDSETQVADQFRFEDAGMAASCRDHRLIRPPRLSSVTPCHISKFWYIKLPHACRTAVRGPCARHPRAVSREVAGPRLGDRSGRFNSQGKRCACATSWTAPASARACASACSTRCATAASSRRSTNNRYRLTGEIRRRKKYRIGYAGAGTGQLVRARSPRGPAARRRTRAGSTSIVVDNRYQPKVALKNARAADPRRRGSRDRVPDRRIGRAGDCRRSTARRISR